MRRLAHGISRLEIFTGTFFQEMQGERRWNAGRAAGDEQDPCRRDGGRIDEADQIDNVCLWIHHSGVERIDFTGIQNGCFLITAIPAPERQPSLMPWPMHFMEEPAEESGTETWCAASMQIPRQTPMWRFQFLYRDQEYTVRRNPEYLRPSKRKECGRDNKVCQRDCKDQPDSSGWKWISGERKRRSIWR